MRHHGARRDIPTPSTRTGGTCPRFFSFPEGYLTGCADHAIIPQSCSDTPHHLSEEIPLKKSSIVVLFLFLHDSNAFAKEPEFPICIPFEGDGKNALILIHGEISPDKLALLERFVHEKMQAVQPQKDPVRVAVIRDGVCIPSE
jgi:hypothetical protein